MLSLYIAQMIRRFQTGAEEIVVVKLHDENLQHRPLLYSVVASTYRIQSMATMSVMSSGGRPTDVSTITMVTRPAWGIPAAPMLAAVAVMLRYVKQREDESGQRNNMSSVFAPPVTFDTDAVGRFEALKATFW